LLWAAAVLPGVLLWGCVSGGDSTVTLLQASKQAVSPAITATAAQNGAVLVSLASLTSGTTIYYTLDGSVPTASSTQYLAPFLVTSNLTVNSIAIAAGGEASSVASQGFALKVPSGTLVWSDEFSNSTGSNARPNPQVWTYEAGDNISGNPIPDTYCAWDSSTPPCDAANPNVYVGTDGYLHIDAEQPSAGVYTSTWMMTQGLFSFQYGRIETRMKLPEEKGMWPAFWLLGNSWATVNWPACGELDVIEHIDGSDPTNLGFDWITGSVHGTGFDGTSLYHPDGFSASDWHTYGMIWSPGRVEYYIDDPLNVYVTFTSSTTSGTWPFDAGPQFLILNLAVGGSWPGAPDATTVFPAEMLVDYVRVYTN
jgi:beta-glucanase (GH16 family)